MSDLDRPDERAMSLGSRRPLLWLLGIVVAGTLLRLYGLDSQSLWLDEVSSLRNAHVFGQGGLAALAKVDQVAPLHSITLWLFTAIGGDNAVSVRLPSVLAGVATIPLTYLVARRMFGSGAVALLSAALVAISPFAIWYSQEGRMYALLLAATVAYVAVAWPLASRPLRLRELSLLSFITLIGLGMHHYMALISVSFGLFLLIKDRAIRRATWAWAASQIVAALIFSYWMILTLEKVAGNTAGNEKPGILLWTPYTLYTFVVGFSFGPTISELATARSDVIDAVLPHAPAIAIVALATLVISWLGLDRLRRSGPSAAALWLLLWLVVPILLSILATFVTNIQFNVRYVIVSYPALAILLALGLHGLWERLSVRERSGWELATLPALAAAVVLLACMTIATVSIHTNPAYAKADVRSLARHITNAPPGTLLVSDNNRVVKMLEFYGAPGPSERMQVDYRFPDMSPQAVWHNVEALPRQPAGEIWLIEYRSWEADPAHYLRTEFERHAQLLGREDLPGVTIRRYRFAHPPQPGASKG